jgi:predicted nucleic acid-binding protein
LGLILDSTVCIQAERQGASPLEIALRLPSHTRGENLVISVVTLSELAFGLVRAESESRLRRRRSFLAQLQSALYAQPVTDRIALRSGMLRADLQSLGQTVELADLLIASTALELGYGVATSNIKHFRRVPGLRVVEL